MIVEGISAVDPTTNLTVAISFGAHVKRLREVRRLTQEELAERSDLAADTIRRLEHQDFSPSLRTLRKVCRGLGLSVSAMFNSFELEQQSEGLDRLMALLLGRSERELALIERISVELLTELDQRRRLSPPSDEPPDEAPDTDDEDDPSASG